MILLSAQGLVLHQLTTLAFVLHVGGGTIGLMSGMTAAFAPKGGGVHRAAGKVFVVSMLVMAAFAAYLAVAMPGQIVNLVIGTFTFYLVATAWMTVWRRNGAAAGLPEKIALFVVLCLCAPFGVLSFQLAAGLQPFIDSAVPLKGPVLIAIYGFTLVTFIAAACDVRMMLAGGISGAPRIARHLWRMCLGLMLATGSAFTNGLPHLLPETVPVSNILLLPQLVPLALLIFWMIRVRFTGWFLRSAPATGSET
jgi:hypothetical protein